MSQRAKLRHREIGGARLTHAHANGAHHQRHDIQHDGSSGLRRRIVVRWNRLVSENVLARRFVRFTSICCMLHLLHIAIITQNKYSRQEDGPHPQPLAALTRRLRKPMVCFSSCGRAAAVPMRGRGVPEAGQTVVAGGNEVAQANEGRRVNPLGLFDVLGRRARRWFVRAAANEAARTPRPSSSSTRKRGTARMLGSPTMRSNETVMASAPSSAVKRTSARFAAQRLSARPASPPTTIQPKKKKTELAMPKNPCSRMNATSPVTIPTSSPVRRISRRLATRAKIAPAMPIIAPTLSAIQPATPPRPKSDDTMRKPSVKPVNPMKNQKSRRPKNSTMNPPATSMMSAMRACCVMASLLRRPPDMSRCGADECEYMRANDDTDGQDAYQGQGSCALENSA